MQWTSVIDKKEQKDSQEVKNKHDEQLNNIPQCHLPATVYSSSKNS